MSLSVWQTPLSEFQTDVAAAQPTPAGVTTACVSAALALSLLVKALRITGKRPDLIEPALQLIEELRTTADADVAAVRAYIQNRDTTGMSQVPPRAVHSATQGLTLCAEASNSITGLIAADIAAATELLQGAANAISACVAANK